MSLLDPRLQAFTAIVQQGTVQAAARTLAITQTGVTQRIRALEAQLSTTLFTRSRKGMNLTSEGEALHRYCQSIRDLEGLYLNEILGDSSQTLVRLTLSGPTSIVSSRIIPTCVDLYREFPNLILNYQLDDRQDSLDLLRKGVVQLAIASPEEVALEMTSKLLRPDRYVLVCSSRWKGRKTAEVIRNERMIDFYESDTTTKEYLQKFGLLEQARPDRIYANTNYALINLIKAGLGYGTLTQEVAAEDLEKGDLICLNQKQFLESPLALVWYPRNPMPQYFKKIIQSIK